MDIKQRLKDFQLLLKSDRKTQMVVGLVAVAALFLAVFDGNKKPRRQVTPGSTTPSIMTPISSNETAGDLITRFSNDVESLQSLTQQQANEINTLEKTIEENNARTAEILKKVVQQMQEQDAMSASTAGIGGIGAGALPPESYVDNSGDGRGGIGGQDINTLEPLKFDVEPEEPEPKIVPAKAKIAIISSGDSVRVRLKAGVQAPTNGRPYPVLLEVISDINGPDGAALPVGSANVIAAAQGSIADQRAMFRLSEMTLRFPSGEVKTVPIDGWVVGEDGILGLEGVLFDPFGKALAGGMMAGTIQGIGSGLAASQTTVNQNNDGSYSTSITGDIFEYGAGRGLSTGANQWSEYIREKSKEYTPYVKVLSGREATAVFSKSASIPGLYDALNDEELIYASLD